MNEGCDSPIHFSSEAWTDEYKSVQLVLVHQNFKKAWFEFLSDSLFTEIKVPTQCLYWVNTSLLTTYSRVLNYCINVVLPSGTFNLRGRGGVLKVPLPHLGYAFIHFFISYIYLSRRGASAWSSTSTVTPVHVSFTTKTQNIFCLHLLTIF